MYKNNQRGFSAVEGLLIVVIVAIIGGVGYYVWHAQKQSNNTLSTASSTSQNTVQLLTASQTRAIKAVQTTYDQYLKDIKGGKTSAQALADVQNDVTPDLYTTLTGTTATDPLFCTSTTPTTVSATLGTKPVANTVNVTANVFAKGKKTQVAVVVDSTSYKLTSITCPAQ